MRNNIGYLFTVLCIQYLCNYSEGKPVGSGAILTSADTIFYYVSVTGNDSWDGKSPVAEGRNGPFASLKKSIFVIEELRNQSVSNPVVIEMLGGEYEIDSTIYLSGIKGSPIIFRSYINEDVKLLGGISEVPYVPISEEIRNHLSTTVNPDHIFMVDIQKIVISDFGKIEPRGFPRPEYASPVEIFINDIPLQLARWPNTGWTFITEVPEGRYGGQFIYENNRIKQWINEKDIWLHGFWARDWADSYVLVEKIDQQNHIIFSKDPHGTYGYIRGQRFYSLNILRELDQPGEYYYNNESGKLIFWPLENNNDLEIKLSSLETPILIIEDSENIVVKNILFEDSRGSGIRIKDSNNILLEKLVVRNIGNRGIIVENGKNVNIFSCEVYNTGEGGIYVSGGDRKSLTAGDNWILNNEIHHTNRWVLTYSPGIFVEGVGNVIKNNYLHDIPHMAIRFTGNDHLIELNEIENIGYETGDAGAIYTGKDWSMRGTIIRNNYFHNISSTYHRGLMAIYLDDFSCGTIIDGNIFRNVQRGIVIGGGRDNMIINNIFQECGKSAIRIEFRENSAIKEEKNLRNKLDEVPYRDKTWSAKYPDLKNIYKGNPLEPENNLVRNNIFTDTEYFEINPKAKNIQVIKENDFHEGSVIENSTGSLQLDLTALEKKKIMIPVEKIGLDPKLISFQK